MSTGKIAAKFACRQKISKLGIVLVTFIVAAQLIAGDHFFYRLHRDL
jgi:hypothetical protein